MRRDALDVRQLQGKTARLEIVDRETRPWGNIGVAEIVFTDKPPSADADAGRTTRFRHHGAGPAASRRPTDVARPRPLAARIAEVRFAGPSAAREPLQGKLVGGLARKLSLAPGQAATVTFVMAWHLPQLCG